VYKRQVPDYAGVYYVMFDVGVKIASVNSLSKLKSAYRAYNKLIDLFLSSEYAVGGKALIIIPDDWDLDMHIKLAKVWLSSHERRAIHARLGKGGYEATDVLVVRRFIKDRLALTVDFSPYKDFIKTYGESLAYAIPGNISNALINADIKCRSLPSECLTHILLAVNVLTNELNNPWIHLLGPSFKSVLQEFSSDARVTSADITGHTINLIGNTRLSDLALRLRFIDILFKRYLKPRHS